MYHNQLDALFILSLLNYHEVYMWQMVGVILELTVSWSPKPTDSQLRSIKSTICHIYTLYLLMMGC
jgi:hypothetical protein